MVFLSLADRDKPAGIVVAKRLREQGMGLVATEGTARYLARFGHLVDRVVGKVSEGASDNAVELLESGEVTFVINTPEGSGAFSDGAQIRKAATVNRVSTVTTVAAALAAVQGVAEASGQELSVMSLQEHHRR
jgi:carbamoyl-phosphate synthase large subunit